LDYRSRNRRVNLWVHDGEQVMRDETIVKIVAIVALTIIEVVNLLTYKIDGNVLLTIGAIIGGIAGYELRGVISAKKKS